MTDRKRLRRQFLRGWAALAALLASVAQIASPLSAGGQFPERPGAPPPVPPLTIGAAAAGVSARTANYEIDVTLDPATRQVTRDGVPVLLSAREFAVLEALMMRPGALLSRAQIEDRLYGWGEEIESNAVSVYVHQLRRKLGADFIGNVRGVGYYVGAVPK